MRPCAEKTCLVILTLFCIPYSLQQWRLSRVQSSLFAASAFVSCCSVFVHLLHCKDCKKERQNYKPSHSFLSALNSMQGGQIHALLACSVLESYKESKSRTTLLSLYIYFLMVWSKLHSKTYCLHRSLAFFMMWLKHLWRMGRSNVSAGCCPVINRKYFCSKSSRPVLQNVMDMECISTREPSHIIITGLLIDPLPYILRRSVWKDCRKDVTDAVVWSHVT